MAALSDSGLNVIVDSVLATPWYIQTVASIFHSYPAYLVCVDISMSAAEQREVERGDRGPGNVRYWYDRIHDANDVYDLRVDAEENDPESCAILIREAVRTMEPKALSLLYQSWN